jgi:hypothetical protein
MNWTQRLIRAVVTVTLAHIGLRACRAAMTLSQPNSFFVWMAGFATLVLGLLFYCRPEFFTSEYWDAQ